MQEAFVAALVAWAAFAVASRYAPRVLKQWLRSALSRLLGRFGWHMPQLSAEVHSGAPACGGCSGCGSKSAAGPQKVSVDALRRTARRGAL